MSPAVESARKLLAESPPTHEELTDAWYERLWDEIDSLSLRLWYLAKRVKK